MKKVGTYLLTIYVTVVTIACGIFGALYFLARKGDDVVARLTYTEARTLVHEVYEEQVTNSVGHSVSAQSLEYKDYNENEFPEELNHFAAQYIKTITSFEQVFNNGWAEGTWLKRKESSGDYSGHGIVGAYDPLQNVNSVIEAAEFFRYNIHGQSVTLEVVQATDSDWYKDGGNTQHTGKYTLAFSVTVTRVGTSDWKTDYYEKHYASSGALGYGKTDYSLTPFHVQYETENGKVVRCKAEQVMTKIEVFKTQMTDDEFYIYAICDCDLSAKKLLLAAGPGNTGLSGGTQLSRDEALAGGRKLYNDAMRVLGTYEDETAFEDFVEVSVGK